MVGIWSTNRLTTFEAHRFPNAPLSLGANVYWDVASLWHEVQVGLKLAVARLPAGAKLASVGVDAWGNDHAIVDRHGRLVFPVHSYRDDRTTRLLAGLKRRKTGKQLYESTGIPLRPSNASLQLAELVGTYPEIVRVGARCLFIASFFNFLLSGKMHNELSLASTSQLLDVHSRNWSGAMLDFFHLPPAWFSPPIAAGTRLGSILEIPELRGALVIAVPGHDSACAYEALPSTSDGSDLLINSGTWSIIGCKSPSPFLGDGALLAGIANERQADGGYRPLLLQPGLWILECLFKDFANRPQNPGEWSQLLSAARAGAANIGLIDILDPAFTRPSSMKAAIDQQLKRRNAPPPRSLAGYVGLVCRSLGQATADAKAQLEKAAIRSYRRIVITGGGARNALLCRAIQEASGASMAVYPLEASALGNLGHQFRALGAVRDLAHFRTAVGGLRSADPN